MIPFQPSINLFLLNISTTIEPKSYSQVVKLECWKKAMQATIDALERQDMDTC